MFNFEALSKIIKGEKLAQEGKEEIGNTRFLKAIATKLDVGDYTVHDGLFYVKMSHVDFAQRRLREDLLRQAGFIQVYSSYSGDFFDRDIFQFSVRE